MATDDVLALLRANLSEVFGERDADRRRAAIARLYTEDATFSDEDGTITGQEALDARVAELHERLPPGAVFTPAGPVYRDADGAALPWALGPEGGAPVAHGMDLVTIADGRIASLRTLLAG